MRVYENEVRAGSKLITDLRFDDDQGMVASSGKWLQWIMDRLNVVTEKYDMRINVGATRQRKNDDDYSKIK